MLLYQNIPSSHFPAQLPSNFFAVRPLRCLAMFMNVFVPLCEHISNVRVNLHLCTRRKQRRRLSSRRTQTHTLEKINENKKKTDTERRQMWRKAMMAQAQQRTQLQTRLIIARAGESSVCVCLCVCACERGSEYKEHRSKRLHRHFHSSRLAQRTNTHTLAVVCAWERGRTEFVAVCALRFTFNFSADSVFDFVSWCGFPHPLSHSLALTTLARSLSPSLSHSLWCALSRGGFCGEFNSSWILTVH